MLYQNRCGYAFLRVHVDVKADALIDFSSPKALDAILTYCMEKNVPAVLCTTGYTDAQMEQIHEAGKKVAVMKSANSFKHL